MKGIDRMMSYSGLEEKIKNADYVFTGEGSLDKQTVYGKTIAGVTRLAVKYHKPVIAFAGRISDQERLYQMGITSLFSILPSVGTLEDALHNGKDNLERSVTSVVRLICFLPDGITGK